MKWIVETIREFFSRRRGKEKERRGYIMEDKKSRWTYFTEDEVRGLDYEFIVLLDRARHISNVPYIITSSVRTPEHNEAVGGVKKSAHLRGFAVDLKCGDSKARYRIIKGLINVGFCRIGAYPHHVHVDHDFDLPQEVFWLGETP